jgi:hypothetical protein
VSENGDISIATGKGMSRKYKDSGQRRLRACRSELWLSRSNLIPELETAANKHVRDFGGFPQPLQTHFPNPYSHITRSFVCIESEITTASFKASQTNRKKSILTEEAEVRGRGDPGRGDPGLGVPPTRKLLGLERTGTFQNSILRFFAAQVRHMPASNTILATS